jgi:opine dehydrogenase
VKRVAIFGAGNAGQAAAAHLTMLGLEVRLYNRWENEIAAIREQGGIKLEGVLGSGFFRIPVITTDLAEAAAGADLFWIATPAVAHEFLARELAPILPAGARIFLNPGSTGGALAFARALREGVGPRDAIIAETNTNVYICRITAPGTVTVWNLGGTLFSAFPGAGAAKVLSLLAPHFPKLVPVATVLDTAFANVNAIMHPAGTLMNTGWIERTGGDFKFYTEGGTPGVGAVIDQLEKERLAAMAALGLGRRTFAEVFHLYGATSQEAVESGSAYIALRDSAPNKEIKAPPAINHRYIAEDVPFGLVPMSCLARVGQVATPVMDSLITLASVVNRVDYLSGGLTLAKMGLEGVGRYDLLRFLREGVRA